MKKNNIHVISDGHTSYSYVDAGLLWIPCQLWDQLNSKKAGLYTVCYHHNNWNAERLKMFANDIEAHISQIVSPFSISEANDINWNGKCKTKLVCFKFQIKRRIKHILGIK